MTYRRRVGHGRGARHVLLGVCCFTIAASCWLAAMSFVLHRPGFEAQMGMGVLFAAESLLTIVVVAGLLSGLWARVLAALGAAGLAASGGMAIALNLSRPHFEGYAVVIGAALVVQGVLTLWLLYAGHPPALRTSAPIW